MALLNYTTTVSVDRTLATIYRQLVQAGARQIVTEYDEGLPIAVEFAASTPSGPRRFHLPVHSNRVLKVLERDKIPSRYRTPEQATRVAWRIVKDWLEAQLAIIETEMVTLDQVMLPYMRGDDGRTVYELYLSQQLALGSGE